MFLFDILLVLILILSGILVFCLFSQFQYNSYSFACWMSSNKKLQTTGFVILTG